MFPYKKWQVFYLYIKRIKNFTQPVSSRWRRETKTREWLLYQGATQQRKQKQEKLKKQESIAEHHPRPPYWPKGSTHRRPSCWSECHHKQVQRLDDNNNWIRSPDLTASSIKQTNRTTAKDLWKLDDTTRYPPWLIAQLAARSYAHRWKFSFPSKCFTNNIGESLLTV
jgi:hypothetical protein